MYNYALKIYAILINKLFIYRAFFVNYYKPNLIKNILFSEKEWWDYLLQKGPYAHRINPTFSKFEIASINNYDLVVPLTIPDLEICIMNHASMPNNPIPFPSIESFNICNDKSLFESFMLKSGFSKYLPKKNPEMNFPFILKKSQDEGGENAFIIRNFFDIDLYKNQINNPEFIKQQVVEGNKEYATHLIVKNGKITNALTIVYIFDHPIYIKGKEKYICRNICKNRHLAIFENILNEMNFNGLCCINYKEIENNPIILEINPRFGGSLCDFFYPFLQKAI